MGTSESAASQAFVRKQLATYGSSIFIEKVIRPDKKGEPDIYGTFKGMPFFLEVKAVNPITFKNNHPFGALQIDVLINRSKSGAVCLGLLCVKSEVRYLYPSELKPQLTKEDWDAARIFSWETLRSNWLQNLTSL